MSNEKQGSIDIDASDADVLGVEFRPQDDTISDIMDTLEDQSSALIL